MLLFNRKENAHVDPPWGRLPGKNRAMMSKVLAYALAVALTNSMGFRDVYLNNPNHFPHAWFEHRSGQLIDDAWRQLCTNRPQALEMNCANREYYAVHGEVFPLGCSVSFFGRKSTTP